MVDQITRTVRQGFLSRMGNSLVGVLVGLCMIPGSVVLVSWNEYRTVHRSRGLAEGERIVAEVADAFEITPELNERLVHVTGTATTEQALSDPDFGIRHTALRLDRRVEMFQWVEHKKSETRDKVGGGRETITTYSYERKWHEGRVNSESFEERTGHENPPLHYDSHTQVTDRATLGAFRLSSDLIERKMHAWKNLPIALEPLLSNFDEFGRQRFAVDGERLYYSAAIPNPSQPQLGDLRIQFRVVEPGVVSVLSKQRSEELVPFRTSNGEEIEHLALGKVSAADMFQSLRFENNVIAWLIRAGGWILAVIGFSLIAAPLRSLAGVVPLLGNLVGGVTFVVSLLLGTTLTLIAIALAWIAVRPLFGIGLFICAGGLLYWMTRRAKSSLAQPQSAMAPPPLPR